MRHQGAGRHHGIHQSFIYQIADDQPLLGHRHGASQSHYHEAVSVAGHCFQHIHRFSKLAAGKRRVGHATHQVADTLGLGEVQRKNRRELVLHWIMQLAVNACAFLLLAQCFTSWNTYVRANFKN